MPPDESWDYFEYEEAWAVFLHSGDEDHSPPNAVFLSRDDAERWLQAMRQCEFQQDLADCIKRNRPRPLKEDTDTQYFRDATILPIRNAYLPVWNSYEDLPEIDPPAVPDWCMDDLRRMYPMPEPVNVTYRQKMKQMKTLLRELLEMTTPNKD